MAININLGLTAVAAGTADVITATYSPAPTLFDRLTLFFRATAANTSTTPTFNPNALGAGTITRDGGQPLKVGDISGAGFIAIVQYDLANTRWELLNPASAQTITGTDRQILFFDGNDNPAGDADFVYQDLGLGAEYGTSLKLAATDSIFFGNPSVDPFFLTIWYDPIAGVYTIGSSSAVLSFNNSSLIDAITQAAGDNSTKVATTEYVDRAVDNSVRVVTAAGAVAVTTADYIVIVNKSSGAATTVNLPSSPTAGDTYIIKDGKGDAVTNNITIDPDGATTIDGDSTYILNENYGSITVVYNGTEWNII